MTLLTATLHSKSGVLPLTLLALGAPGCPLRPLSPASPEASAAPFLPDLLRPLGDGTRWPHRPLSRHLLIVLHSDPRLGS